MSLVTKLSRRRFTDTAVDLIVHNHPKYLENKEGVYPSCRSQRTNLIAEKTLTKVSVKYANFEDVFSPDLASKLSKHTRINNYAIKLVDADKFIRPSNWPVGSPILFDQEADRSIWLCVNYKSLNNLTIAILALIARMVRIVITSLMLLDKLKKGWFFQKTFCWLTLAWFFTFSSTNIRFASEGLTWLETIKRVELLNGGPGDNDK